MSWYLDDRSRRVGRPAEVSRITTPGSPSDVFARLAIGVAIVVVLTACGGGSTPLPSIGAGDSPAASSTTSGSSSAGGSFAPVTTPSAGVPSLPAVTSSHSDPALEALLPAEVSGTPMQRSSATLASLLDSGGDRSAIDAFLQGLGKSESDGTIAAAFDPTNTFGGGIFAFKIAGVNSGVLLPAIVSVEKSDLGAGATTTQATVGGKSVTVVSVGNGVNDTEWVYGHEDVVFVVHAADEAHAATFLQALS